jgi:hypothetical protein
MPTFLYIELDFEFHLGNDTCAAGAQTLGIGIKRVHPATGALFATGFYDTHGQLRQVSAGAYGSAFGNILPSTGGNNADLRQVQILAQLGVEKEHAVYIGDSNVDAETARNAGLACICVDWGFRDREQLLAAGAGQIVSSPEELLHALLS